jgi:hypothetical protein
VSVTIAVGETELQPESVARPRVCACGMRGADVRHLLRAGDSRVQHVQHVKIGKKTARGASLIE